MLEVNSLCKNTFFWQIPCFPSLIKWTFKFPIFPVPCSTLFLQKCPSHGMQQSDHEGFWVGSFEFPKIINKIQKCIIFSGLEILLSFSHVFLKQWEPLHILISPRSFPLSDVLNARFLRNALRVASLWHTNISILFIMICNLSFLLWYVIWLCLK